MGWSAWIKWECGGGPGAAQSIQMSLPCGGWSLCRLIAGAAHFGTSSNGWAPARPRTARLLDPLERRGWAVLHDLAVPGTQANIDWPSAPAEWS